MPRDADALKIRKWAESGDVATPESQGLDRATGWPASYSAADGDLPKREVLNQVLREWSALGVELNTRGLLEWDSSIAYAHSAVVMGSDGQPYVSAADSQGVDPVADNGNANWKLLALQGPTGPTGPVGPNSQFTYESLNSNGDVGAEAGQVAQGDHSHVISTSATNSTLDTVRRSIQSTTTWRTLDTLSVTVSAGETVSVIGLACVEVRNNDNTGTCGFGLHKIA